MRVPVIVASEAYKFCEKVQLDSVVYNELGSASEIVSARHPTGGDLLGKRDPLHLS
jgi:translation initiation factor 2B subunit (eIF-2B alpha/beta/delta family)